MTPRSLEHHEACKGEVRRALARIHEFDPRDEEAIGIWDTVEQAKAFRRLTDGMRYFLGAVGVATLFIGAIGVMNVMLVAVRERTREIGVRRALGATRRSIVRQFFVETLIVVFASGGAGLAVAYSLCAPRQHAPRDALLRRAPAHLAVGPGVLPPAVDGGPALGRVPGEPRRRGGPDRGPAVGGGRVSGHAA